MATKYKEIDISTWKAGDTILISHNSQLKSSSASMSTENLEKGDVLLNAGTDKSWNIKIIK